MPPRSFNDNAVFLNIPYDGEFEELYLAYIVGLCQLGFDPCIASGIPGGERRLDRVLTLIQSCRYSIHDLSRVELSVSPPATPRFNMPLELGITITWAKLHPERHTWFLWESVPRRLQKSLSDLDGTDPYIHYGTVEGVLSELRNAFVRNGAPQVQEILRAYRIVQRSIEKILTGAGTRNLYAASVFNELCFMALDATQRTSGPSKTLSPASTQHISEIPTPVRSSAPRPVTIYESQSAGGARKDAEPLPELIGNAPCMLEVSRRVHLTASRTTPVLIEGPTGSGKHLVAEALHKLSSRSHKPFVAVDCAAIPEALLEAELFGYTRRAFSGAVQERMGRTESADGGTLFLDQIGEMPLALQSKVLRIVECGELQREGNKETVKVDVRVVAATSEPLAECAQAGTFRADLYYRLAIFLIRTPALSEHIEDMALLVDHFLKKMGRGIPVKHIDREAMAKLAAHNWPGNVRELEQVLERAANRALHEPVITAIDIEFGFHVN